MDLNEFSNFFVKKAILHTMLESRSKLAIRMMSKQ